MDPDPVLLPGKFHVSLIFITASIKKQTKKNHRAIPILQGYSEDKDNVC